MNKRLSFFLLLSVAFLDYMGVGLVFPILPAMLFNADSTLLPATASNVMRGCMAGRFNCPMSPFSTFGLAYIRELLRSKGA